MRSVETFSLKTYRSLKVTTPAFSIAPHLYSWAKTWSYLVKGKSYPKNYSKNFIDSIVI